MFEEPTIGKRLEVEIQLSVLSQGVPLTIHGQNIAWAITALNLLATTKPDNFKPTELPARYSKELIRVGNEVWDWIQKLDSDQNDEVGDPEGNLGNDS